MKTKSVNCVVLCEFFNGFITLSVDQKCDCNFRLHVTTFHHKEDLIDMQDGSESFLIRLQAHQGDLKVPVMSASVDQGRGMPRMCLVAFRSNWGLWGIPSLRKLALPDT